MKFQTGMDAKQRDLISHRLSKILADTYTLYLKTQNFHWNYTGKDFYSHHLLFEKQYKELADAIDEIAERIRALGGYVQGTMDGFKKLTTIKEKKSAVPSKAMVSELISGHEIVIQEWRSVSLLVEKENDGATIDLSGRRLGAHEKFTWMLRSIETD